MIKVTLVSLILLAATAVLGQKKKYEEDLTSSRVLYTDSLTKIANENPVESELGFSDTTEGSSATTFTHDDVSFQVDSVIHEIALYNKETGLTHSGFRVQIYNGRSEAAAVAALEGAKEILGDDIYGHPEWQSPVFRTRVGCFTTRLEAFRIYLQLQEIFPNALIVPDHGLTSDCIK